jgi:hypothetical protein
LADRIGQRRWQKPGWNATEVEAKASRLRVGLDDFEKARDADSRTLFPDPGDERRNSTNDFVGVVLRDIRQSVVQKRILEPFDCRSNVASRLVFHSAHIEARNDFFRVDLHKTLKHRRVGQNSTHRLAGAAARPQPFLS